MNPRGFTLLEVLVALTIMAAVVLGVGAAVSLAADVAARGRDRADAALRAEAARSTLRGWLQGASLAGDVRGEGFVGRNGGGFGRNGDEISFVTHDPGILKRSPGARVRLTLSAEPGPDGGLLVRWADLDDDAAGRMVLVPDARGLEARYLVQVGDERRWFDAWSSRVRLPLMVRLELQFEDADSVASLWKEPLLISLPRQG